MYPRHRLALLVCVLAIAGAQGDVFSADIRTATEVTVAPSVPGFDFSLGTYTGISYGIAKEFVYNTTVSPGYYLLSELDWPLRPAYFLGTRLSMVTRVGLRATVDFKAGVPSQVGEMTDTDYQNYDSAHTATNFSKSPSSLERLVDARAEVGWSFALPGGFSITPFARFSYLDLKWSANGGYAQYPPGYTSGAQPPYPPYTQDAQQPFYGVVILYEQRYVIPAVGLSAEYRSADGVGSIGASFAYSPFASVHDVDDHLLADRIFYDAMAGCSYFEPSFRYSLRPTKDFELSLDISYLAVYSGKNGVTTGTDTTNGSPQTFPVSTAGASVEVMSTTIGANFHL